MIIWGGKIPGCIDNCGTKGGAKYNPKNDTWEKVSDVNSSSRRYSHSAIWTGKEMIIYGGAYDSIAGSELAKDGKKYDPELDKWDSISNVGAPEGGLFLSVWTSLVMIVWDSYRQSGAMYKQ